MDLSFEVLGADAVPYALVPTLSFPVRIRAGAGEPVQSVVLRCQVRVEPERRRYDAGEQGRLLDVFGAAHRWSETVKPFLWTHVTASVGAFEGATEAALTVACSYDLEVTAGKYFHALRAGEIPLLFLFSGTVFTRGPQGLRAEPIPWDREARHRLPVAVWRELMDAYFPDAAWLRLRRDTVDALMAYKSRHAFPTWDDAVSSLLTDREVTA